MAANMSYLGALESSSVGVSKLPFPHAGEGGLGAAPLDMGTSFFADEMWQLKSQRSQLEHENMLLRWQLENTRLAQENSFLQHQIQQQRVQSWMQERGEAAAPHNLGASIARSSQRKLPNRTRENTARLGKTQHMPTELTLPISSAFSEQSTTDASSLPVSFSRSDESVIAGDMSSADQQRTTCMIRNIPESYTRQSLLELIDSNGFTRQYHLVYLPMDFKNKINLGYAFVDFTSGEVAQEFFDSLSGFCDLGFSAEKMCEVSWSTVQGYHAHIERYRNSPVMHSVVPDDFKPVLFVNGQPAPFPEPTKRVSMPRCWKRSQE
jgi:hypothetical protein